jgi:flagellin
MLPLSSAISSAEYSLYASGQSLATSMERLSTGLRINSAADDPAGLIEVQSLTSQLNGANTAIQGIQDNTSLTQIASAALTQETSVLQNMLTLATQSASGTLTTAQLASNQAQMNQYAASLTQIANSTTYNGQNLLTGGFSQPMQMGSGPGDYFTLSLAASDAASLGVAGNAGVINQGTNTANVSSLLTTGSGMQSQASGEQYQITATQLTGGASGTVYGGETTSAANTGTVASSVNTANQASAAGNQGGEWMTLGGTSGGAGAGNYLVQVSSVNADGTVAAVKISADGGNTWSAAVTGPTFNLTGTGGLTATFAAGAAPAKVGDTFSFTANNSQAGTAAQSTVISGTNVGRSTITFSGTYTGTSNVQYAIRAVSEDGTNTVTGIQVSTDGGNTWGATIGQTVPGTPTFAIGNGLSVNWNTGTFNNNRVAANNDTYDFNAVAANQTTDVLQLSDSTQSGGTAKYPNASALIGQGTLLNSGQTSATVGTGTMTATASFNALGTTGGITAGTTTFSVATPQTATNANGIATVPATAPGGLTITSTSAASAAITTIQNAINQVGLQQANVGAAQNQLTAALTYQQAESKDLTTATGNIMDANIPAETVNVTAQKIIQQSAQAMLAQALQLQEGYLRLLGITVPAS